MSYNETTGSLTTYGEDVGPYVAISHVWADGLGSNTEKGLPTCQIKRIHKYVCQLLPGGTPAFWIDGLCIPEERELRKMAIRKMGDTYKRALKVLVFDESIRTLCSPNNPPEENVFRISMCPWMQRVWTLQEALLAEELYFEFAEEIIVPAHALRGAMMEERYDQYGFPTFKTIVVERLPIWGILGPRQQTYGFEEIVSLLVHRMTSKPSDEPLAIAGLLNVDTKKLDVDGKTDLESRLQALFLEIETFSAELLWTIYPRMEQSPGFRWAPASLTFVGELSRKNVPSVMANRYVFHGDAVCSSRGITTERVVPVLYFTDVHIAGDRHDPSLDSIFLHDSPRGALYQMDNVPCRHATVRTFNGIVFGSPSHLGVMPEGTRVPTVAVNILDCERLGPVLEEGEDVEEAREGLPPIVCEFVQHVDVSHRQIMLSSTRALRCRLIMSRVTFR